MLTGLRIKNFKRLEDVEIELGSAVVFVGPNNSGKTTALQALALWEIGLRKWREKRSSVTTINQRDLVAVPVPEAYLLWKDLKTSDVRIGIEVSGITNGSSWECGFEFEYANEESLYCHALQVSSLAWDVGVAFLPPMSGMAAVEDRLTPGAVNVRIGEGRTAEVLRNLCFQIYSDAETPAWDLLAEQIQALFGITLSPPKYLLERGQITMSYAERGIELDLASSGRGLQQTLLLLAHLYSHPGTVLLLDEPDAHLEVLRQRQIYRILTETAESQGCQVIAASHSEILLNEAAERDIVVAFVGKPHRIDDRRSQVLSLRSIGFDQYYQAEQTGWVLYLEGSTDLAILQSFAESLGHPASKVLEQPFVHYVANQPAKARDHFYGLREAKRNLAGIAIFDSIGQKLESEGPLSELQWRQREIENYLCFPETLLAYARESKGEAAMNQAIDEVVGALKTLGRPDPFGPEIKASDDFLEPVFQKYFEKLNIRNLMQKTDYHILARLVPRELIDPEVGEKLDRIVEAAGRAHRV